MINHTSRGNVRNSQGFVAIELPFKYCSTMNAADVHLMATPYPREGFAVNEISEMIVRIICGKVQFTCDGESEIFKMGDVVLVPKNKPYRWKPVQYTELFILSWPPWTPEQHKIVHDLELSASKH